MRIIGRVCVAINGVGHERFLNITKENDVRLDNVCIEDGKIVFWIDAKDFATIKKAYKKTGLRPRIIKKTGIIFKYKKVISKKSILLGLFIFIGIIYGASQFIWNIKIEDNYIFSKEELIKTLGENNIKAGQLIKKMDCSKIENILRIKYNEISFVSARIEGSTLVIQIKENAIKDNKGDSSNRLEGSLISPCDGEVVCIVTAKGTPMVKKGDEVKQGQVLIDGKIEIMDDYGEHIKYNSTLAKGDVYVVGKYNYESKMDIRYESRVYGESKKVIYLRIGENKLILYKPFNITSNCDIISSECQIKLNNDVLKKIYLGTISYLDYSTYDAEYTDTQAKELLTVELNNNIERLRKQGVIVNDYSLQFSKDEYEMKLAGYLQVVVKAKDYADIVYDNNEKGAEINVGN